ncbi:MAG TPA: hypothetical protein VMZ29_11340 [Candidatus Bathyarchaeia archaeon]|nr:hypothetical protein [Candidatus Bathyarchaeia archaeon]
MSDNLDNLLGEIYSSSSQSQGVKELANLINNLSQLLLRGIGQLEARVLKIEQQMGMSKATTPARPLPPPPPPATQSPVARSTPAPMPKVASPFSAPTAPVTTPRPPPPVTAAPVQSSIGAPSVSEAASMLGVTLKKAPTATTPSSSSGPSFLTSTVSQDTTTPTVASTVSNESMPSAVEPDASAPASLGEGGGIAGPAGGFRGELAEKLARRRQKVQEQLDDDFSGLKSEDSSTEEEESTSSELKLDLEDELRNAFSKLKG